MASSLPAEGTDPMGILSMLPGAIGAHDDMAVAM
jgi:hypothetical protein